MVIVRLIGGLGNQLFQYAAARRVAHMNGVPLKLDVSGFESYQLHAYSLGHLNIIEDIASPVEIAHFCDPQGKSIVARFCRQVRKLMPHHGGSVIAERHFHFDPRILDLPGNVYLDGYWQSEKYFKDIESIIRSEFIVKTMSDPANEAMSERICGTESVSVHVRRKDYVSDSATSRIHGGCSLAYYYAAAERIARAVAEPHFFVFSDDAQWARENLDLKYPTTFVTHNGPDKNFEDLRLMTLCNHHIVANSTFSWWGAWLSINPDKMVIAPRKWFAESDLDCRDLIPDSWRTI